MSEVLTVHKKARHRPYAWEPLTMTRAEVAETVFRRTEAWFTLNTPDSFPAPVDGLYATEAVREWVRQRHGLALPADDAHAARRTLLERASGLGKSAVSRRQTA